MIDITKKYTTRDGRAVVLLSDKGPEGHPIVGYISGDSFVREWTEQGGCRDIKECLIDLLEAPEQIELDIWLNIYPDAAAGLDAFTYADKGYADRCADRSRLACINIKRKVKVGEGL
jgi:hypothetical protein